MLYSGSFLAMEVTKWASFQIFIPSGPDIWFKRMAGDSQSLEFYWIRLFWQRQQGIHYCKYNSFYK